MKIRVDNKSAPGEVAACDDCEYYKHIRDMDSEEFHYCTAWMRKGDNAPAIRLKYKASECDFFAKDKSEDNFALDNQHLAWHLVEIRDPSDRQKILKLLVSPGDFREYRARGILNPEVLLQRGLEPEKPKGKK